LAEWLALEPVDAVVSSPQRRALETAAPVAAAHGLGVVVVEGLIEYDAHSDSYIPMEELRATKGEQWTAMVEGRWEDLGGESARDFRTRIVATLDDLVAGHPGKNVVAVCHGGVINVALASVLGVDRELWFEPAYTSMSRMAASRNGVRSIEPVNERAHLEAKRHPPAAR
jgi:probable phosphoglycerate mutase